MKRLLILSLAVILSACHGREVNSTPGREPHPTKVRFTPSTDHLTSVDHYELQVMEAKTGQVVFVQNLGKPTPDATNTITVPLPPVCLEAMQRNTAYSAAVAAVGPMGEHSEKSVASNTFTKP